MVPTQTASRGTSLRLRLTIALGATVLAGCTGAGSPSPPSDAVTAARTCAPPPLAGTRITVQLQGMGMPAAMMGGSSMGQASAMMTPNRPMMRLRLAVDRSSAPVGIASFVATNDDAMDHELVVIPLAGRSPGDLRVGVDGTANETGKVGEASRSCGQGPGDGIAPGASSWVTADLRPGEYVVLCNEPGHYAAGMFAQLTVG